MRSPKWSRPQRGTSGGNSECGDGSKPSVVRHQPNELSENYRDVRRTSIAFIIGTRAESGSGDL